MASSSVPADGHGGALTLTMRALRAAGTLVTPTGPHPQLTHIATNVGTPIHHHPTHGAAFVWGRASLSATGLRRILLGSGIAGGSSADVRVYISTTIMAPTMPADLMHLAAAQEMFPSIAVMHSIHGPRHAIGAAVLELAFTAPSGPPPPHTS